MYMALLPGTGPNPVFDRLAWNGVCGLLAVSGLVVLTYAIAYRKHSESILEAIDFTQMLTTLAIAHCGSRGQDATGLACAAGSLSIHQKHSDAKRSPSALPCDLPCSRNIAGAVGAVRGQPGRRFPFVITDSGMLALPLILSFFVVSGLRATFNIPYELPANWLFRVTETHNAAEYITATRRFIALWGLLPLMSLIAVVEFAYWSPADAIFHLAFEWIISVFVLNALLFNFQKVPFTCSYYPGKKNMAILAGVYLYGFTTYSSSMVALERWLQGNTVRTVVFLMIGVGAIACLSLKRRNTAVKLIYEEKSDGQLQSLELS
jgi:hypothetical protein